jgi:hypothetical protein
MKPTYFCNKKSLQITSPDIRNDVKKLIGYIGSFNLISKYYTFLNKKNVNNLKESNFLVSLSTFGKKFVLFVTKYNTKKYCIFINKKNDIMTVTQLKFADDIFNGTLFDGELVKNNNDKWIYLINDIAYYKGKNIVTLPFSERQLIVENILKNEHDNELFNNDQTFYISKKNYFEYKNIKDIVENYSNALNYKSAGLYFKNVNNFSDNYLFIFPECRSDSKILNNGVSIDHKKDNVDNDEDDLFKDVEVLVPDKVVNNHPVQKTPNFKLEKTTCRFLINGTSMPDIYELYCKNTNNYIEKYNYASVPDIDTSNFLKSIITENYDYNSDINTKIENNSAIYVECNYHKVFKKWIPYKKVDSMDNITTINQIQIILDSL